MIDKFDRSEMGRYYYDMLRPTLANSMFIRTDGSSTIVVDIDLNSFKLINVTEPVNSHDAATKSYVDTHSTTGVSTSSITSDLHLNFHKLINANEPSSLHDAATKNYVDVRTSINVKTYGSITISGDIDLNSHKLINVSDPVNLHDAATKNYVDRNTASGINNITTDVNLNLHKLTNVANPTNLQDAATKSYVDVFSQISNFLGQVPNSSFSCLGLKSQTIAGGLPNAVTVFTYSDGPGVLRRLWLANNDTVTAGLSVPGKVFIRIFADGEIGVGNYSETTEDIGTDNTALACDLLFSPLGGPFYANSLQGSNVYNTTSLGGYVTLDMPFRTSLAIQLFKKTASRIIIL